MIESFANKRTQDLFHGNTSSAVRKIPTDVHRTALRKLDMLNVAKNLQDLRNPPGNRLEPLKSSLKGFHGIRINDQWRIVFRWEFQRAYDVEIVDYH